MNSPPIAEFLDMIKEMTQEDSMISTMYKIVKTPSGYYDSMSVVCDTEIVYGYDDLCVRMAALDVSGWAISGGFTGAAFVAGSIYNVVTIHMTRVI